MLGLFLTPYEDELLYSVFARHKVRMAIRGHKPMAEFILGKRDISSTIDLPCHLKRLFAAMPPDVPFSPESFLYSHTLFPLFYPFLDINESIKLKNMMLSDYGGAVHLTSGVMSSSIRMMNFLRFCPECLETDLLLLGESYWRRLHQVPGVFVCPTHGVPLQDSVVSINGVNKQAFFSANSLTCPTSANVYFGSDLTDKLLGIAVDVQWLLSNKIRTRGLAGWYEAYNNALIIKDLAYPSRRVKQVELYREFRGYYGDSFLSLVQSTADDESLAPWLAKMMRRPRSSVHPLRHILVMRFLSGSVRQFLDNMGTREFRPFLCGPWPCLNPIAEHYLNPVIDHVKIEYCKDTQRPIGVFNCDCGFVYTRRGPDLSPGDQYKIGRVREYGTTWHARLSELVKAGVSLRGVSRCLKVACETVKRQLHKKETSKTNINEQVISSYRQKWLELPKNSTTTKTSLRELAPGVYGWLYRNDREWLDNNSPKWEPSRHERTTVDWHKRDLEIYEAIKLAKDKNTDPEEKPKRITIHLLSHMAGCAGLIEKHQDKLPITAMYLRLVTETKDQFRLKRVQWAFNKLKTEGEVVTRSKIQRLAGFRSDYSETIRKEIDDCIIIYESEIGHKALEIGRPTGTTYDS